VFIEAKDDGDGGDNWSYKSCIVLLVSLCLVGICSG